jgi:hypothetical protein
MTYIAKHLQDAYDAGRAAFEQQPSPLHIGEYHAFRRGWNDAETEANELRYVRTVAVAGALERIEQRKRAEAEGRAARRRLGEGEAA